MKILVINGPNLNMLGIREPNLYGERTYAYLETFIQDSAREMGIRATVFQSNHEGEIVTCIQKAFGVYQGIIINAAAYTHTSVAILDALKAVGLPTVEVHLTDISKREAFRQLSYVGLYAQHTIMGQGFEGYHQALAWFLDEKNLGITANDAG